MHAPDARPHPDNAVMHATAADPRPRTASRCPDCTDAGILRISTGVRCRSAGRIIKGHPAQAMTHKHDERQQLRQFILGVAAGMVPRDDPENGTAQFSEMTESINGCDSLTGLREAARDMVEWSRDLEGEAVANLDAALSAAGAPTLTQMRDKRYRAFAKIIARGRIRNDDEYRLVEGLLAETALPDQQVDEATRLQHEYGKAAGRLR